LKTIKFEFLHDDNRDYSFLNIDHTPNYDFSELRMKAEEILKPKLPDILKAVSEKLNIYEWIVEILLLKTNTSLFHSIEIYPKKIKFPIFQLAPLDDAFLHYPTAYSYSAITLDESYLDMLNEITLNEVTLLYAYNGKETDIQITEPFISLYFEFENFINDLKKNKLFPMNPYSTNMDMNFDCIQIMIFNNVNPEFKWTAFFCQEDFDYYSTDNTSINHINQSDFLKTMIKGNVIQNGTDYLDIITNDNIHEVLNNIKIMNY
jgi:hypothetical protein